MSVKRVQAYLSLPELDLARYYVADDGTSSFGSNALVVRNGFFSWRVQDCRQDVTEHTEWTLADINIAISSVSLCVVCDVWVCICMCTCTCICMVWCMWCGVLRPSLS